MKTKNRQRNLEARQRQHDFDVIKLGGRGRTRPGSLKKSGASVITPPAGGRQRRHEWLYRDGKKNKRKSGTTDS